MKRFAYAVAAAVLIPLPLGLLSCSSSGGGGSTDWKLEGNWTNTVTVTRDPCDVLNNSTGLVRITQSGTEITFIDQFGYTLNGEIDGDSIHGLTEHRRQETDCWDKVELTAVIWDDEKITGSADYWWSGEECGLLTSCTATTTFELTR